MTVKIGVNPIAWTNDDMTDLGRETTLDTCLKEGKQAGYAGFELGGKFPKEAKVLNAVLQKHTLELISGWYDGRLLAHGLEVEIHRIDAHLQLLKNMGAGVMVYCDVTRCVHTDSTIPLSHRPTLRKNEWDVWTESLNILAEHTANQGVRLAYHHHMGCVIQTGADIERLMASTSSDVGLLFDTGHLVFAGEDPAKIYAEYHSRINHVHCKDVRENVLNNALNRNLSFLDAVINGVFTAPGDGFVDFPTVFSQIKEAQYNGWMVVEAEQDPEVANPLFYMKRGYEHIRNLCESFV